MPKLRTQPNKNFKTNIFGKTINFVNLPNQPTYIQSRVLRIKTKEPETIEWIDNISKLDTLFDIGANIGIYTLCAGAKGIETYAFEPHAGNYNILCQNISANPFPCIAYCLALSDRSAFDNIAIENYYPGVADNVVSEIGEQSHGVITHDLDPLLDVNSIAQPHHMKIDIDGHEYKFFQGAKKTIAKCKSILIEIENQYADEICADMRNMGFNLISKHKRGKSDEHNFIFSK